MRMDALPEEHDEAAPVAQPSRKRYTGHGPQMQRLHQFGGKIRWHTQTIVHHPFFDYVVFLAIMINVVSIGMDTPVNEKNDTVQLFITIVQYSSVAFFALEMAMKIIVMGLWADGTGYLDDRWNVMDGIVVLLSLLGLVFNGFFVGRALRVARPLRILSRIEGTRIFFTALLNSVGALAWAVVLLNVVVIVFGLYGLIMFKERIHNRCHNAAGVMAPYEEVQFACSGCTTTNLDCGRRCPAEYPYCYTNSTQYLDQEYSYDNIYYAYLHTMQIVSADDWPFLYLRARSSTSTASAIYFISVLMLGAYFCMKMLLGTIVHLVRDASMQAREEDRRRRIAQLEWEPVGVDDRPELAAGRNQENANTERATDDDEFSIARLRLRLLALVESTPATIVRALFIAVNLGALFLYTYPMNGSLERALDRINIVCTVFFTLDVLLRLILYLRDYLIVYDNTRMRWVVQSINILDLAIVAGSLPDLAKGRGSRTFSALRAFRVLGSLHKVTRIRSFHAIAEAMTNSLEQIWYLLLLALVFTFILAVLGVQLFDGTFDTPDFTWSFDDIGQAMLTVFICMSAEKWTTMVQRARQAKSDVAAMYFVVVYLFGALALVNMFTAVMVDQLSLIKDDDTEYGKHLERQIRQIEAEWQEIQSTAEPWTLKQSDEEHVAVVVRLRPWQRLFNWLSLLVVVASIIPIAMDGAYISSSTDRTVKALEALFLVLFIVEFIVRALFFRKKSLVRHFLSMWVLLDVLSIGFTALGLVLRFCRALRVFRLYRICSKIPPMRQVMQGIFYSFPRLLSCLAVMVMTWLVLAVFGMHMFRGRMDECLKCDITGENCYGGPAMRAQACSEDMCKVLNQAANGTHLWVWAQSFSKFDNIFQSLYSVIVISIGEEWTDLLRNGMDSSDIGVCLGKSRRPFMAIYFVITYIIGNFVLLNLVTAILIQVFIEIENTRLGTRNLAVHQQLWVCVLDTALSRRPRPPPARVEGARRRIRSAMQSPWFIALNAIVIFADFGFLVTYRWPMTTKEDNLRTTVNFIFCGIYLVEMALMLYVSRTSLRGWEWYDLTVVVGSTICLVVDVKVGTGVFIPALLGRYTRVFRTLRVLISQPTVRELVDNVVHTIPSYITVVGVMIITIFVFAAIGVQLYGRLRVSLYGSINPYNNFQTVPRGLLLGFILGTQDLWVSVTRDLNKQPPACDDKIDGDCGSHGAYVYMLTYIFAYTLVLLGMSVAVIVERISREKSLVSYVQGLDELRTTFGRLQLPGTNEVPARFLVYVLYHLPAPLCPTRPVLRFLAKLRIPITRNNTVRWSDCVKELSRLTFDVNWAEGVVVQATRKKQPPIVNFTYYIDHFYAQHIIVRFWRMHQGRRRKAMQWFEEDYTTTPNNETDAQSLHPIRSPERLDGAHRRASSPPPPGGRRNSRTRTGNTVTELGSTMQVQQDGAANFFGSDATEADWQDDAEMDEEAAAADELLSARSQLSDATEPRKGHGRAPPPTPATRDVSPMSPIGEPWVAAH
eukprot:TRINITY_DN20418_c0_g2_i2.p1 TRINITY_DN20418_c0_g2~~TRINITY_DN20418_c0_g2_i2.p1  ORF type:complete len:1509 (-),score=298.53 TRINITY_DN20418_c0_g2_i2:214-4740(-)